MNVWSQAQNSLNNLPNIGGDDGISPNVPNDRVFQALGSNENRRDLLLTDAQINGAKGRMFILRAPTALDRFRRIAEEAARSGTDADAQIMLQHIRAVSILFPLSPFVPSPPPLPRPPSSLIPKVHPLSFLALYQNLTKLFVSHKTGRL